MGGDEVSVMALYSCCVMAVQAACLLGLWLERRAER